MSDFRITQESASMRMVTYLQSDLGNLTNLQEESASGKSLMQPSDNPTGTSEVLSLNTQIGRFQQYATNAGDGQAWLNTATTALGSVTKALDQVQTNLLSGANNVGRRSRRSKGALPGRALPQAGDHRYGGHHI